MKHYEKTPNAKLFDNYVNFANLIQKRNKMHPWLNICFYLVSICLAGVLISLVISLFYPNLWFVYFLLPIFILIIPEIIAERLNKKIVLEVKNIFDQRLKDMGVRNFESLTKSNDALKCNFIVKVGSDNYQDSYGAIKHVTASLNSELPEMLKITCSVVQSI